MTEQRGGGLPSTLGPFSPLPSFPNLSGPTLTFEEADSGLRKPLGQAPHEEFRAEELRGDEGTILGKANLIWGELAPLCGRQHSLTVGIRTPAPSNTTGFTSGQPGDPEAQAGCRHPSHE